MLLLIGSFLLLLVIGAPVAVAMAVASLLYLGIYDVAPDIIAAQRMIAGVESFPLIAVPFFILAGNLMNIAGVTGRIYHFALSLVGWMKGGLAQVNIIGSVIFSGMSGTALADAAGIGTIEIKAMKDHGYPVEAAVGVTAASATLGPIFPPSLPFVIYGMMANASVGALFLAGILPGVLMIETMAQTGGWLLLALHRFDRMAFLAQVKEAKLRAFVAPSTQLAAEARLLHDGSGYAIMAGRLEAAGKTVAEAELTYRLAPFPNPSLRARMLEAAQRVGIPRELLDAA